MYKNLKAFENNRSTKDYFKRVLNNNGINNTHSPLTPLLDLILTVCFFVFMTSQPISEIPENIAKALKLNLPKSSQAENIPSKSIATGFSNGTYFFEDQKFSSFDQFRQKLNKFARENSLKEPQERSFLVISVDEDARWGKGVDIINECVRLKILIKLGSK